MTEVTGNVLLGLDEFKLRSGHLSLVCEIAKFEGGSSRRLASRLIDRLTQRVELTEADFNTVGEYLANKKLCVDLGDEIGRAVPTHGYRYQDIGYRKTAVENSYVVESVPMSDKRPAVWFQDYCLAQRPVRSRVGAITDKGKAGSKTGISHILDWAQETDLVSRSGIVSPLGELIAHELRCGVHRVSFSNPYVLGPEIIPLSYAFVEADFDIFAQLIQSLSPITATLARQDATNLYIEAVLRLTDRAETAKNLSTTQTRPIYSLWRDLEKARKKTRRDDLHTKTAWHRASSRFETLTDLGFLSKTDAARDDRYQYRYRVTDKVRVAAESLNSLPTASEWFDKSFLDVVLGRDINPHPAPPDLLAAHLPPVVEALKRPTAPLPMIAVILGLAMQLSQTGCEYSMGGLRQGLRQLAVNQPTIARVSRGTRADSAGLISFDVARLESLIRNA